MNFAYKCNDCGNIYYVEAKNFDDAQTNKQCPKCDSNDTQRYMSAKDLPGLSRQGDTRNLKSPDWYKDKVDNINKEMGTNAKVYK